VMHANPYPYYAALIAERPLYFDSKLKLWVASSAEAVSAVLLSDFCHVRPIAEPVPNTLLDSSAGDLFGHLVRMTDGQNHCPLKGAIFTTLNGLEEWSVIAQAEISAREIWADLEGTAQPGRVSEFAFRLPVDVLGGLLSIPKQHRLEVADWIAAFVACLSPLASTVQLERGKWAAGQLQKLFHDLLHLRLEDGLLVQLSLSAQRFGLEDRNAIAANAIGFMTQAYEATAGLISNTLLFLAQHRALRTQISDAFELLPQLIWEVSRFDAPIQNTRRYLVQDSTILGQEMGAGDSILLVLAAANRDEAVNPDPHRFDLSRVHSCVYTFGAGVHACPGEHLAVTMAVAAVRHILESCFPLETLAHTATYRKSVNARIAVWDSAHA
jgi:cytochrome P450